MNYNKLVVNFAVSTFYGAAIAGYKYLLPSFCYPHFAIVVTLFLYQKQIFNHDQDTAQSENLLGFVGCIITLIIVFVIVKYDTTWSEFLSSCFPKVMNN